MRTPYMRAGRTKAPKYFKVHDIRLLYPLGRRRYYLIFMPLQTVIISQFYFHGKNTLTSASESGLIGLWSGAVCQKYA